MPPQAGMLRKKSQLSVEVILDNLHGLCIGILLGNLTHKIRIVYLCPMLFNTDYPHACMRIKGDKNTAYAITAIFVVNFLWHSWFGWNRNQNIVY